MASLTAAMPACVSGHALVSRGADEPVAEIVQCGEPFFSIICGQPIFRPIFTLPFSEPISCGFFFGAQELPDSRMFSNGPRCARNRARARPTVHET